MDDALAVTAAAGEHEPAPRDGANHRLDVALVAAPEDRAEAEHGSGEEASIRGVEDQLLGRDLGARIRAVPDDRRGLVEDRRAGLFAVDLDGADEDQPFDAGRLARSEERACPLHVEAGILGLGRAGVVDDRGRVDHSVNAVERAGEALLRPGVEGAEGEAAGRVAGAAGADQPDAPALGAIRGEERRADEPAGAGDQHDPLAHAC